MATQLSEERRAALIALTAHIKSRESLPLGILAGAVGALIGAAGWAAITATTGYQIGYAAIGVAFLVGYGMRTFGNGVARPFGIAGAALALMGCVLGNLAAAIAQIAKSQGIDNLDILHRIDPSRLPDLFVASFRPMDVLFYGFALYFGYKYSLRRLTKEEIAKLPA